MIYNSEATQYSTSCCACLLIFGDKPKCKHRPLLCVPPCSCWAWRNPPSPRWASGVGPSRPPLDSQGARSKGSDLSRSGRRDAPGAGSEERPACEARRSVGVSLCLNVLLMRWNKKIHFWIVLIFQDGTTQHSRSHENGAVLVKRSLFVCVFFLCFFFISRCSRFLFTHWTFKFS